MSLSWLDRIVIARADEQAQAAAGERFERRHDRDGQDVVTKRASRSPSRWRRRRCLAGDCDRTVRWNGYCHVHGQRVARHGDVDGYAFERSGGRG